MLHPCPAHHGLWSLYSHYYSFIRDRNGDELGRWMMFNDSSVSFFNPEHIEREAFGGEETFRYAGYGAARVGAFTQTRCVVVPMPPCEGACGFAVCMLQSHVHPALTFGACAFSPRAIVSLCAQVHHAQRPAAVL